MNRSILKIRYEQARAAVLKTKALRIDKLDGGGLWLQLEIAAVKTCIDHRVELGLSRGRTIETIKQGSALRRTV